MPVKTDAVGYLSDLAVEIDEPWFTMITDIAAAGGASALDQPDVDALVAIYTGRASYVGRRAFASSAVAAGSPVGGDALEELSGFSNFKGLGDALHIRFDKRVTLLFGANGSGKSSICESLKVLAAPGLPTRPLENVRSLGVSEPTFRFKFSSDPDLQTWTPAVGYGPKRATIKYFDTAIALENVANPVEPGRVVVVSPFKLHVFEQARALTTAFRGVLQQEGLQEDDRLARLLTEIRSDFAQFAGCTLATIDESTVSELERQIGLGEAFDSEDLLHDKKTAADELVKATSEEGLSLLRAEYRELEMLHAAAQVLTDSVERLWAKEPHKRAKDLEAKRIAQEVLLKDLIPQGGTLERLLGLVRAASTLCNLGEAAGHACPLCKRVLDEPEVELFRQYHAVLVGELEGEIVALADQLAKAREDFEVVGSVDWKAWGKLSTIPNDVREAAQASAERIVANCDLLTEPADEAQVELRSLKTTMSAWAKRLESKALAIEAARAGREELVKQLAAIRAEIGPMEYAQEIAGNLNRLRQAQATLCNTQFWKAKLPEFTQLLKRLTETAKEAYEGLVVADFEERLNAEYRALAEKSMEAFGVKLARRGADATVTVLPQVGGRNLNGVLSEGEQRLHALALFFAELEACPQSVLVFDDPISSFDYNYIANYCTRLRDFVHAHPSRQVIVLTHNWEFFVQLQTTINQAALSAHLAVLVLEHCSVVGSYSEKLDDLKSDISVALAASGEPSRSAKEVIAGKMRRLIEAVVNTYVFNQQRHQYKQKSQVVSAFKEFTRIVPLLEAEATMLRDLYAKLSVTEHDDPRNAYVNTEKAVFQSRFDQIVGVETAIRGRIPG